LYFLFSFLCLNFVCTSHLHPHGEFHPYIEFSIVSPISPICSNSFIWFTFIYACGWIKPIFILEISCT
jgi:hypothetical protein